MDTFCSGKTDSLKIRLLYTFDINEYIKVARGLADVTTVIDIES